MKKADIEVNLIESMGSDLSVANAARVSFDKVSELVDGKLKQADVNLINFLARGLTTDDFKSFVEEIAVLGEIIGEGISRDYRDKQTVKLIKLLWEWRQTPEHFVPFCHPHISFRIKIPIAIARQIGKHQVGFSLSEESRRYVTDEPEFYFPDMWRKAAENKKQGSLNEGIVSVDGFIGNTYTSPQKLAEMAVDTSLECYKKLLAGGVCAEQARFILPQNMMTQWVWTGSLWGFARVCKQRLRNDAQKESRDFAKLISNHMEKLFPVSWEALVKI